MSSSSASDTFYQDLKIGLEILVFERLPKRFKRHHYLCFYPRSPSADYISGWGCWCEKVETHPHDYKFCKDKARRGLFPDIIKPGAYIEKCGHHTSEERGRYSHRFFCFKPTDSVSILIDWLLNSRASPSDWKDVNEEQRDVIRRNLREYAKEWCILPLERRSEKINVLCGLASLRNVGIPKQARQSNVSWEAERLLNILGWRDRDFKKWAEDIRWAMGQGADIRFEREEELRRRDRFKTGDRSSKEKDLMMREEKTPTDNFRGQRSGREGERRGRSPPREQYGLREEPTQYPPTSSRGKSRRGDERQWQDLPDERYYEGDERQRQDPPRETPRHNLPKEQPRRARDKSSRPKEQSGGGYKSRHSSPLRGVYETVLDNLPEGQFMERVTGFWTDEYERRLTNRPRGEFMGRVADFVTNEYEIQLDDLTEECERGLADALRRYGGGGSSSSRRRHERR
ncbi:hypothetical protein CI102_2414 [Trichoderma harzianum]|nr:hypothetical protein CI102_2414 [Trichoderma harzianum]